MQSDQRGAVGGGLAEARRGEVISAGTGSDQRIDAAGKQLWTAEVVGKAGDTNAFTHANRMAENIFAKALAELATKASEQFASPAFQQALAQ